MHAEELSALQGPISNEARVLYCLCLRPYVDLKTGESRPLEYKAILATINAKQKHLDRGRQINRLVKELAQVGLVTLNTQQDIETSLNGQSINLPMVVNHSNTQDRLYENASPITFDWQPNTELLTELLCMIGVIDTTTKAEEIGEFVAYWRGRPDIRLTEYQWTQRLAQQIKRNRTASGMIPVNRVGTQIVNTTTSVDADDNAKKLVEKYSKAKDKR
ncbi:flavodoxin [Alteromonas sediminis]|uniref:Flavodoxin n=1 Tax=Alteromonas sediminis TaxID=2259342 RepID=A0A3N5XZL3_9ALTE|nr:DnaT-like ssDNA-binding domain-containing protein [Alteromonas sediminis]RPJ66767.1 flavodoxin [Alteromonas sediminis]